MSSDPQKQQPITVGKDVRLAYARVGVNDAVYLHPNNSAFQPEVPFNVRNYFFETIDVTPVDNASNFGDLARWRFGKEGYSVLQGAELVTTLPRLGDALATNIHPGGAGYGGAGGAGTFLNWKPFVGECLLGGNDSNRLFFRYLQNTLREVSPTEIHWKRRLCQDSQGTARRAQYLTAVGATQLSGLIAQIITTKLWLPWASDEVQYHKPWPMHAFGTPTDMEFRMPALVDLVETDIATPATNVVALTTGGTVGGQPDCFLRLYYFNHEKTERQKLADLVNRPKGLTYQTCQSVSSSLQTVAGDPLQSVDISLKFSRNPAVFVVATCRMLDDTKSAGQTATHNDTNAPARSVGAIVQRPDPFRLQPVDSWALLDGQNLITPRQSARQFLLSDQTGHANFFPSAAEANLCVVPLSISPCVEDNGLGHTNFNNMNEPILRLFLPAQAATETGGTRVVQVHVFERNKVTGVKNQIVRHYNV